MNRMFVLAALLAMGFCLTACGGDEEKDPTDIPVVNPEDSEIKPEDDDLRSGDEVWTPDEQQIYLEDVGMELNRLVRVSDFRHYIELANFVSDRYGDDYEWDNVDEWMEDILDGLLSDVISTDKETQTDESSWGRYVYNTFYTNYKATIMASNFVGHWTARNGKWQREDANDLQFIFKNKVGEQCVLSLTTSGKVVKVHMFDIEDWTDYSSNQMSDGSYVSNNYYDRTQYTLGVPEKIEVKLIEGGNTLISESLTISLGNLTGEEFDLSKGKFECQSTTTFNNGYEFKMSRTSYSPGAFSSTFQMSKNGSVLITSAATSSLQNMPRKTLTDWFYMDDDEVDDAFENANAVPTFTVNFLGKVQLKGNVSDVRKLADNLDEADDNEENESAYKRAIQRANSYFSVKLYYNGGKAEQAFLSLEPFKDYEWTSGGTTHAIWDAEMIINFPNGTTYSFDEYFTEDAFKDLIDSVDDQGDEAEDMWD